ncbi:MAG: DUF1320 family protein [Kiritimatiellae bacterium]|nr:DUF1320 family protein [Kiritimatiellia bacterium]
MDWVTLSEADLAATISQREIDAFRQDASTDGTDAVQALLDRTAATVRVYLASNTAVRLDPDPLAIPPGLVSPACAIAAYDILKRLPVPVGEDRKNAKDEAMAMLSKIASGQLNVAAPDETGNSVASSPKSAPAHPQRLLD